MPTEHVLYRVVGAMGEITLNRPDKLNSISAAMVDALHAALDQAEADSRVRVISLKANGRAFSSGFDLSEMESNPSVERMRAVLEADFDIIMRFWNCPKPTVSAVQGYVLGGGFELAMACDVTLAASNAVFGEPEPKFGSGIVALLLPWLTGPKQAKEMLLFGNDRVSAERAYAMGLINQVLPPEALNEACDAMARRCATLDATAVRLTKSAINRSYGAMGMEGALRQALELDLEIETTDTDESRTFKALLSEQGVKAAIAWREARFAAVPESATQVKPPPPMAPSLNPNPSPPQGSPPMTFKALLVHKNDDSIFHRFETLEDSQLPEGNVTVAIDYSTVNYKDGLCLSGQGGLVRTFPHVPGIDFAGRVESSTDPLYQAGDAVVLTGWRVGENRWGGYATKTRVQGGQLVKLPAGISTRHAMAVGTAGLTAMLALMALEDHGLVPGNGPVLVTGASGGVGSVAVLLLARLGYEVAAVTGRPEHADYLRSLGATSIVNRADIAETVKRPLESESWAGCIDAVGGSMLARVLGQMKYGASVAALGLAGGANLPTSVIPFLLRGVNLLGIDSVMQPHDKRVRAWARIGTELPLALLEPTIHEVGLDAAPAIGQAILAGQVKGRTVINLQLPF